MVQSSGSDNRLEAFQNPVKNISKDIVGIFVIRNKQNADEAQIMALCDQVYLSHRRTKEIKATFERFQIVSLKDFKGNA